MLVENYIIKSYNAMVAESSVSCREHCMNQVALTEHGRILGFEPYLSEFVSARV